MRISVITGLFAITLLSVPNPAKAGAAQIDLLKIQESDSAVTQLIASAELEDIELKVLDIAEEKADEPVKHVVEEGETLDSIAKKYETEWKRLFDKNTEIVNPDIISSGEVVVVPEKEETLAPRELPQPVAPVRPKQTASSNVKAIASTSYAVKGSSAGNGYVAGYCTWYVKSRRPDMPNNLGNASTWVSRAAAQGIATGSTPRAGAVAQRNNHVAYVESVNGDGTITISEMNYRNLYEKTVRTVSPAEWRFIY